MGLVDDQQVILGKEVHERIRRLPRLAAGEMPGVVFDAEAGAGFAQQLQVIPGTLLQALRLEELVEAAQLGQPLVQLRLDAGQRPVEDVGIDDIVGVGIDGGVMEVADDLTGHDGDLADALDDVAKELDAQGPVAGPGRKYLQHIAAHPERAAREGDVVAHILDVNQASQGRVAVAALADSQRQHQGAVGLR